MLDARLERRSSDRHVAAAGGAQPIHRIELEVVDRGLGGLLPRMVQVDSLPQGAALAGPVEGDDGNAKLGQWEQEVVELLDERIVSAGEEERAAFFALCLKSETRQMSARIRNGDALVAGDALHSESPVAREVVVEAVAHVAGGQIELRAVIVGGGVQVALLGFRLLGDLEPSRVPGIVVLDTRRNRAELLEPGRRRAVEQRPVERVVHARIGQQVQERHGYLR